jgi:hypothetical protein
MFFRGEFTRPDFSLMARSRRRLIIEQLGIVHRKENIGNGMVIRLLLDGSYEGGADSDLRKRRRYFNAFSNNEAVLSPPLASTNLVITGRNFPAISGDRPSL